MQLKNVEKSLERPDIGKTALTKAETRVMVADVEKKEEYLLSP